MPDNLEPRLVTLRNLPHDIPATVSSINGGMGLQERLGNLGIRPGQSITKIGAMMMRGPVTVKIGRGQVAIGYGMAGKIICQTKR
ncbi:ferrous iron transport protein A [Chloroflexota bacterium]